MIAAGAYYPTWMQQKDIAESKTFAKISYVAVPYSVISDSTVKVSDDEITMNTEVPANTIADVFVPAANAANVSESGRPLSSTSDIKVVGSADGYVQLQLGSGVYHFTSKK